MQKILDRIQSGELCLKELPKRQLPQLCAEIREFLIEHVSKTGGHLSSNLGTVELTVALHRIFTTPEDAIVFDVGHQCYTHKILTGRADRFDTLRQEGGLSGFPNRGESEHDAFIAGHGNTALSAAIGIAQAKKLKGEKGTVIAVIGDGAFTGGMVYEGMNNIDTLDNLVVILNDNKMSISKNVGSFSRYLTNLRTSASYHTAKHRTEDLLDKTPVVGKYIKDALSYSKSVLRRTIYNSTFFEEMGFQYLGPLDGHNINELLAAFSSAKQYDSPLFIHIETVKGKGFIPAERNPGAFHGVGAFDTEHLPDPDAAMSDSFSEEMGIAVTAAAQKDERICAVTAAMKYATGLHHFSKQFRRRFFDVGMAEQHAVTFAAGLAVEGMRPVVAIYSTFFQRSYDQFIHDVNLQRADVLFAIDRAGLVPGDGETHQGIYDVAFFSQFSNVPVFAPSNYAELRFWMDRLLGPSCTGPRVIRYPKGAEHPRLAALGCSGEIFDKVCEGENAKIALVTYGLLTAQALFAVEKLRNEKIAVSLFKIVRLNPLPEDLIGQLLEYDSVYFIEDAIASGSVGIHLGAALQQQGYSGHYRFRGLPTDPIDHAVVSQLQKKYRLDADSIAEWIKDDEKRGE